MTAPRGTLCLVVGPSGAGKDTLLNGARAALAGDPAWVFPRRAITRPAEAGGEDHAALSAAEFARCRAAGGFALHWRAHGLDYGIPATIEDDLAGGRHVVVNVSRGAIVDAAGRFAPVRVLLVTAPAAVLARRLAARGREDADDIARRLRRAGDGLPDGVPVVRVVNDATPEEGIARFLAALAQAVGAG